MNDLDHRPYLADTDLRTAEDVARWLREQIDEWDADCDTANPRQVVACVADLGKCRVVSAHSVKP